MLQHIVSFFQELVRYVERFEQQQWLVVVGLVVIVGIFMLRGYTIRGY